MVHIVTCLSLKYETLYYFQLCPIRVKIGRLYSLFIMLLYIVFGHVMANAYLKKKKLKKKKAVEPRVPGLTPHIYTLEN